MTSKKEPPQTGSVSPVFSAHNLCFSTELLPPPAAANLRSLWVNALKLCRYKATAECGPKYVVFHNECTPHDLRKGDCSRARTGDGMKKQQFQEEWLQDAAFQLMGGETEGSGLTLSP